MNILQQSARICLNHFRGDRSSCSANSHPFHGSMMTEPDPLHELLSHLKKLQEDPKNERLSTSLVDQSRLLLHRPDLRPSHVVELARLTLTLLRSSQDDLEPLVRLLSDVLKLVAFDDLQDSIPVEVVTEGLSSPSPHTQNLGLSYLKKAAESPSGAAFVANDDALVKALVQLFLTSESADIGGTRALEAILSLLSVDNPDTVTTVIDNGSTGQTSGQGLLWRRIFHDEEVYHLFFCFTSTGNSSHDLSKSAVTTAQARLFDFVSEVAKMRWDAIHDTTRSELHSSFKTKDIADAHEQSLLQYATFKMVDRTDPLMTNILVDFLTKLLELKNPAGCSRLTSIPVTSSPSLEFLVSSGLHQRAIDYYLRSEDFDSFEIQFLGGAQIRYLCTYVDLYPEHFLQSADLARNTINRLNGNLQISRARWAHGPSPTQDLNVLAHIPAVTVARASRSDENPLMLLPTNPANADAFETLGKVFHGPISNDSRCDEGLIAEPNPCSRGSRAASARLLFYQYHDQHPEFWSNIGAAMNVLAMPEAASAAIGLVRSILTAVWARPSDTNLEGADPSPLPLPSEQNLRQLCGGNVSETGVAEVLNAGESVIQSLLTPLKTMGGDVEAARLAWRLGREKFEATVMLSELMKRGVGKSEVPGQVWQTIAGRVQERIRVDGRGGASTTTRTNLVDTMGG
jgi:DNA mismatch repair protein HSM3, N terminal domain